MTEQLTFDHSEHNEVKLEWNVCHWCECDISRSHELLPWIDEYEAGWCEFHPAVFDTKTMKRNNETAPHQTIEEVHIIVKAEFMRIKALRAKEPLRAVKDNVVSVAKNAQGTSMEAAKKLLPRSGSIRAQIYEAVKNRNIMGMTDSELEELLKGKHQTISSSRRSLVVDGFLVDSGKTRKNSQGNECVVWVEKSYLFDTILFGRNHE